MQHGEPQYPLRSRLTAGDIHAAVDRVVAAHGAYIPVELLLDTGLLRFVDYEAWRRGQHVGLDSLLADDLDRVIPLLREAARWAGELGFEPETRDYFGWGDHANQRLALFGADPGDADGLLATHYVRRDAPASGDQLDLFFDGRATVALGDLRAALRARDVEGARRGLAVVAEQAPHHDLLPFAQRLIDALRDLPNPVSARQAPAELTTIERRLAPAAQALLGPSARDLMTAFWQRLALVSCHGYFAVFRAPVCSKHKARDCVMACHGKGAQRGDWDTQALPSNKKRCGARLRAPVDCVASLDKANNPCLRDAPCHGRAQPR